MKKVNLNLPIVNIENKELKEQGGRTLMLKGAIANVVMQGASTDPIRSSELARKIYNSKKSIELEDSDYKEVVKLVKETKLINLVKGQIYAALEIK